MIDLFSDNAAALTAFDNVDNVARCRARAQLYTHALRADVCRSQLCASSALDLTTLQAVNVSVFFTER